MSGGVTVNPDFADVLEDGYVSAVITVGTSQVEAKVGASRQSGRELLYIENQSNVTIYYGPSGVTTSGSTKGSTLLKDQFVFLPIGNQAVYLIAGSAGNSILVQEMA